MNGPLPDRSSVLVAELLRNVPLFAPLPDESAACFALLQRGTVERHRTGDLLITEGAAPSLLVLLRGAAETSGRRLGRGEHVGEVDLLLDRPAVALVRATAPTLVYRLSAAVFREILPVCRRIADCLCRVLASELDRLSRPPIEGDAK